MKLLSLMGLSQIIDAPESAVKRWTAEFQLFIPKTRKQNRIYYLPEAASVLLSIKRYYDENYSKSEIMKLLAEKSFPSEESNSTMINKTDNRRKSSYEENLITMMQTIGKTVANVSDQDKILQTVKEQQSKQNQ